MRVVAISDIHSRRVELPAGDILIVGGDLTSRGSADEIAMFIDYLESQQAKFRYPPLVIAGNHDFLFEQERREAELLLDSATYLEDQLIEVGGLRIYGSPWTPTFGHWAFMKERGAEIACVWESILEGLDILVTHGPPRGILDHCSAGNVGCADLLAIVSESLARPPTFHVFGHIHEGFGKQVQGGTTYINVSICDRHYQAANPPTVFEID